MILTYCTPSEYAATAGVDLANFTAGEYDMLLGYLRAATAYITTNTRRRFIPSYETRWFPVPADFQDLSTRRFIFKDLVLDGDLLEPVRLQTTNYLVRETNVNIPAGGVTAADRVWTLSDIDRADATGKMYFAVGNYLRINDEYVQVLARYEGDDQIRVQRGALKTRAAAHTAATPIKHLLTYPLVEGIDFNLLEPNIYPKWSIRLEYPNSWVGVMGASAYTPRRPFQIFIEAFWGYQEGYGRAEAWIDTEETVAAGGLAIGGSSLSLTDAARRDASYSPAFVAGGLLRINDELLVIESTNTTLDTAAVQRGAYTSVEAAHAEGDPIRRWEVQADIRKAAFSIAKVLRDSDTSVGGRKGVTDNTVGVQIRVPDDAHDIINLYRKTMIG